MADLLGLVGDELFLAGDLASDVSALLRRRGREGLIVHVQQVVANAQRLANRFGVNEKAAVTAAWFHDVSQVLPSDAMLEAALAAGLGECCRIKLKERVSRVVRRFSRRSLPESGTETVFRGRAHPTS
ncbi:MAG: HD domain-containing protein, partial [Symbiobacteriia bacterium]